jgi:hypothetical protein
MNNEHLRLREVQVLWIVNGSPKDYFSLTIHD